jgi:hypothetical protein
MEEETTQEETMEEAVMTHPTIERAQTRSTFLVTAKRWLSKLPDGKRAKLESKLLARGDG